jgi:chaperone LolA
VTPRGFFSTTAALCGLLLTAAHASAQATDALAVLQGAAARYRASTATCADFTQELDNPLLREKRSGRGRTCWKEPSLFMMRFSQPAGDVMLSDGQYFWRYMPSSDRAVVTQLPIARVGALDPVREFLVDTERKYVTRVNGQETIEGSPTNRVVLVPKVPPINYKEAELWIDSRSSLLRRVEIREENGLIQRYSFTNVTLNATPPADAFRFSQPAGTQIIRP